MPSTNLKLDLKTIHETHVSVNVLQRAQCNATKTKRKKYRLRCRPHAVNLLYLQRLSYYVSHTILCSFFFHFFLCLFVIRRRTLPSPDAFHSPAQIREAHTRRQTTINAVAQTKQQRQQTQQKKPTNYLIIIKRNKRKCDMCDWCWLSITIWTVCRWHYG